MGTLDRVILTAALAALTALVFLRRERAADALRRFLTARTHPVNLAVFRIVVFAAVIFRVLQVDAVDLARALVDAPSEATFPPAVGGDLFPELPGSEATVDLAGVALLAGAAAALVGFRTRLAAAVTALAAVYVLGIPQWFGKVNHDHHHLVWFCVLLAASPSGDALSLDRLVERWRARRRGEGPRRLEAKVAYALPLRITWVLLGVIYLFAGLGKLIGAGFGWMTAENLRNHMWLHWFVSDWTPPVRVDEMTLLLQAAAIGAVLFEVSFLALMLFPRLRPFAAVAGFSFHFTIRYLLRIPSFWTLQIAYVTFVDWEALWQRLRRRLSAMPGRETSRDPTRPVRPARKRSPAPVAVAGGVLVAAGLLMGATFTEDGWPVAAYPTFGFRQAPTDTRIELHYVNDDGERHELTADIPGGSNRVRFLTLRTLAAADPVERERRLHALVELAGVPPDAERIEVFQVRFTLDPDGPAGETISREEVATLDVG